MRILTGHEIFAEINSLHFSPGNLVVHKGARPIMFKILTFKHQAADEIFQFVTRQPPFNYAEAS
jgi:hypothetical protein